MLFQRQHNGVEVRFRADTFQERIQKAVLNSILEFLRLLDRLLIFGRMEYSQQLMYHRPFLIRVDGLEQTSVA